MYHHAKPENEILETDGGKGRFQTPVTFQTPGLG
jgi:hypothetical protein